ncbi:uncharacterized protein LOC107019291 [Solanum pennellii]|uniref:ATP-dependent DNA helicase n=1 Tax=Solanum pennellii TaxID=28526 RepID=A0ABM1GSM6_SOLPN|nr:uncharacterized protein LOC107019291 [Solanum pennellii]
MAKRHTIETVDRSFRDIMDKDVPFGGKIMVFGGDFRQVFQVVLKSTRSEMANASLVRSYLWPLMEKIQLSTNMRAITDQTFSDFLLHIGNGQETTIKDNLIEIPKQMTIQQSGDINPEESLDREIFPEIKPNYKSAQYITEHTMLARTNEFVDKLIAIMIEKFHAETKTYISFDSTKMIPGTTIKKNISTH